MKEIVIKVYERQELEKNLKRGLEEIERLSLIEEERGLNGYYQFCRDLEVKSCKRYTQLLEATDENVLYVFKGRVVNNDIPEWLKI